MEKEPKTEVLPETDGPEYKDLLKPSDYYWHPMIVISLNLHV